MPDELSPSSEQASVSATAGWYADGHDPRKRYWDGSAWTDRYEEPTQPKVRRRVPLSATVWTAVGALVLGLIIGGASGAGSGGSQVASLKSKLSDAQYDNSQLKGSVNDLQAKNDKLQADADAVATAQAAVDAEKAKLDALNAQVVAGTIPGNGTYLVGTDVQPGTYRSLDNAQCYWERDKDLSGGVSSIADNDNITGQGVVTIAPTDKAFKSSGCNDWHKVG